MSRVGFYGRPTKGRFGYYATRGRVARNCWTCDRKRCKCDPVEMRRIKRGAKHRWRVRIREEQNDV